MKIEYEVNQTQVSLEEIQEGGCFRWGAKFCIKTDKTSMSHWVGGEYKYTVFVVELDNGHIGEMPPDVLVTRESAKVVIE